MKGRWFFWIPVILYGLYIILTYSFPYLEKIPAKVYYITIGFSSFLIWPYYDITHGKNLTNYEYSNDEIIQYPLLLLWFGYLIFFIIHIINKFLDKYLTIK